MHSHIQLFFCSLHIIRSRPYSTPESVAFVSGEFGSERLVQKAVDTILRLTAKKPDQSTSAAAAHDGDHHAAAPARTPDPHMDVDDDSNRGVQKVPMKIILEGEQVSGMEWH